MITRNQAVDTARVADAAVAAWEIAAGRLSPIIGEEGFHVLYKRSLHLTASTFPWLAATQTSSADAPFADLRLKLERETPARAEEASRALFVTFTRLLNGLIGEALTTHFLTSAPRNDGLDEPTQEIPR